FPGDGADGGCGPGPPDRAAQDGDARRAGGDVGGALSRGRLVAAAAPQPGLPPSLLPRPSGADDRTALPMSLRPAQRHLIVFAKAPVLGRVKRRLGREVGTVGAWTFYRRTVRAVVGRLSSDRRWTTWI